MKPAKTYVVPKGTPVHFAMPNTREMQKAVSWLRDAKEHAGASTATACARVADWLEVQSHERTAKLERRLAGGRAR
jgi:hypothetical protein